MKESFKSFDDIRRSGKIKTSSNRETVFILVGLRKKYLARCQISRSNYYLQTIKQNVFFNIVKESFKSFDLLRRSGEIKIGSNGERFFVLGGLTKKYLARCQILRSKYYL